MENKDKWLEEAYAADRAEKEEYLREHPDFEPDGDFWDSHSCSAFADSSGVCQWCGNLIYGSSAYCDAYGCDPPEATRYDYLCQEYYDYD